MAIMSETGIYGKLPANGDFLLRNLPTGFVNSWDQWLQQFMSNTREYIGGEWLDIYLTNECLFGWSYQMNIAKLIFNLLENNFKIST